MAEQGLKTACVSKYFQRVRTQLPLKVVLLLRWQIWMWVHLLMITGNGICMTL